MFVASDRGNYLGPAKVGLGIELMRNAGLGDGLQVEILPDLDELVLADIADQDDWQLDLRTRSWPVLRSWPFFGDHARMHILPAELRPIFIDEDVCGFDARSRRVISPRYGAHRQLPEQAQH